MGEIKAGDMVRVLSSRDGGEIAEIASMIGEIREVESVERDGRVCVFEDVEKTDYWFFRPDEIELVSAASPTASPTLEIRTDIIVLGGRRFMLVPVED